MLINTTHSTATVSLGGVDITQLVTGIDLTRTTIIQAVINLVPNHGLQPKPGQLLKLNLAVATSLVVQTYTSDRITCGCWLAVYLQANASLPSTQLSPVLGVCLKDILTDRGIPANRISLQSGNTKLGSIPTLGDDPVQLASFAGFALYSDASGTIKLAKLMDTESSIGSFTAAEVVSQSAGTANPLSANRITVEGVLSQVNEATTEYKVETETPVRGGVRKVTKEYEVRRNKTIETETIKEPRSQVSSFGSNFESSRGSADRLLSSFSNTRIGQSVVSQVTEVTTEVDRDNYLKTRTKVVTGMAAKGLSKFFAAWASAEIPPPPDNTDATDESAETPPAETTVEFSGSSGSITGDYNFNPVNTTNSSSALTIAKPTGLFREIDLEYQEENWEWSLDEVKVITNPSQKLVSFKDARGKCVYSRVKYLPIGAILPEMGNPIFGYQTPISGKSNPKYLNGARLTIAEKEVIIYTQEESGDWIAERTLEQAIGVRNAQEPLDAMRSVQFDDTEEAASRDRSNVALNVATQLTVAINERTRQSPPAQLEINDTKQYTKTRPYKFAIELGSDDLLDRSVQLSPSPFVPSITAIASLAKYQALQQRGQAQQLIIELPLAGLTIDLPPNSLLRFEGKTYILSQLQVTVKQNLGTIQLTVFPF